MQALVEYYSEKGWLQRVEQCILHMDISSLDFNQVISMLDFYVYFFLIFQEEEVLVPLNGTSSLLLNFKIQTSNPSC